MFVCRVKLSSIVNPKARHTIYFNELPSPSRITEEFNDFISTLDEGSQEVYQDAWGDLSRLNWNALVMVDHCIAQGWAVSDKVYAEVENVELRPGRHILAMGRCCP